MTFRGVCAENGLHYLAQNAMFGNCPRPGGRARAREIQAGFCAARDMVKI
jgi:hypothetical protein